MCRVVLTASFLAAVTTGVFSTPCAAGTEEAAPSILASTEGSASLTGHAAARTPAVVAIPTLRVMTFNARVKTILDVFSSWNSRKDLLVESIRQFNPDIVGTQELLARQADFVRAQLPDYGFVGVGRKN